MMGDPSLKRIVLEMGSGSALHSMDYTKAATRAVTDALRHSSLTVFRSLGLDPNTMHVEVTLAAKEPEKIDVAAVRGEVPFGTVEARAVRGGLNVMDDTTGTPIVIVNAALIVRVPL